MPYSDPYTVEAFRDLVCNAIPNVPALQKVALPGAFKLAWQKLVSLSGMSLPAFTKAVAAEAGMEVAESLQTTADLLKPFPEDLVRHGFVLPLQRQEDTLPVAIANPANEALLERIASHAGGPVTFLLAAPEHIEDALFMAQASVANGAKLGRGLIAIAEEMAEELPEDDEHAISRLAKQLLRESIALRASDLHIQPFMGGGVARARVDGMLRRISLLPETVYTQLARYFKVQSSMDPANSRSPQDGRASLTLGGKAYEMRVSALPARGGERVVIRFLDQQRKFQLSHNGFSLAEMQALRRLAGNSSGLVVITGPTGSGKTSTLYALLGEINTADRNILTVENPVEYLLTGISQVEVNEKAGLTFSSVLRSALRQDPDVILVGEVRDEETADIAMQAALTGHLVFTTLHTNDAISTIPRLLDLKIRPSILADTLAGVVAQRLCRKLCIGCRTPLVPPLAPEEQAFHAMTKIAPPYRATGCEACDFTGFFGRVPISEIIEASPRLREAIHKQDISTWYETSLGLNSLGSLASSATRRVISGDTSVKEVVRVLGVRFWSSLSKEFDAPAPEEALLQTDAQESRNPGVLLYGHRGRSEQRFAEELEHEMFSVFRVYTPEEARDALEAHDNIVCVVADMDENKTDEEIVARVRHARTAMSWSRLPALLLLPPGRKALEALLRADGATSPVIYKPLEETDLVRYVRMSLATPR